MAPVHAHYLYVPCKWGYKCSIIKSLNHYPIQDWRNTNLMPNVKVRDGEPFDIALRRFKRSCEKAGILTEVRRREFYEKPTQVRKRKLAAAVKRQLKKVSREINRRQRLY